MRGVTAMAPRLFVYKMTVDNGGAPCVVKSLLSLAICKPAIRRSATEGDLIFGFGANPDPMSNRLIYIAEVSKDSKELTNGDYYRLPRYALRPDCIYEWTSDGEFRRR